MNRDFWLGKLIVRGVTTVQYFSVNEFSGLGFEYWSKYFVIYFSLNTCQNLQCSNLMQSNLMRFLVIHFINEAMQFSLHKFQKL